MISVVSTLTIRLAKIEEEVSALKGDNSQLRAQVMLIVGNSTTETEQIPSTPQPSKSHSIIHVTPPYTSHHDDDSSSTDQSECSDKETFEQQPRQKKNAKRKKKHEEKQHVSTTASGQTAHPVSKPLTAAPAGTNENVRVTKLASSHSLGTSMLYVGGLNAENSASDVKQHIVSIGVKSCGEITQLSNKSDWRSFKVQIPTT